MANRSSEVSVWIRIRDTSARAIGEFRRNWQAGVRVVKDMAEALAKTTAVAAAFVFGLTKMGQQGDKVLGVQAAFARTTNDAAAALERLREASGRTISDFDLMARHNQMLALGTARSTEEFARMLETSRALAESLGIDDVEAMNKLANVMASGSKRAARELGLEIRAGMTRNQILEEAEDVVRRIAGATGDASDAGDRFVATMTNIKDRLSVLVAESPIVAAFLDGLGGILEDAIAVLMGDVDTLLDGMKTIGRMMADAVAIGINEGIEAFVDKGNPFGRMVAGWFGGNADAARGNFAANRVALGSIARSASAQAAARRRAGGGGPPPPGGAPELDFLDPWRDMGGFGLSPEALARHREREAVRRRRFDLGPALDPMTTVARFQERFGNRLPGIDVRVPGGPGDAALELENATEVAVDSLGRMADAAVNESQRMESAIIQSFQTILANIKTKEGGLFGSTLLGGVLGIGLGLASSLFNRGGRREPTPVALVDVSDRAAQQMREKGGEPIHVTNIVQLPDGTILTLDEIEIGLYDRQRRHGVLRYSPRTGRPLRGR